jgi:hypothetical protein
MARESCNARIADASFHRPAHAKLVLFLINERKVLDRVSDPLAPAPSSSWPRSLTMDAALLFLALGPRQVFSLRP